MEHEGEGDTNCNWCTRNKAQRIGTGTRRLRNQRTRGDHPDYGIIKIGQNPEKSPGDLRRIVNQIPVKKKQQKTTGNTGVKNSKRISKSLVSKKIKLSPFSRR